MIISILNADNKFGIGKKNGLLFSLPLDMEFFRKTTLNHTVAMGENTLLSFPHQKPLKNRVNIVLSSEKDYEGTICFHNFDEFINELVKRSKKEDVYIIGGASIYKQTLPYVDKILLTKVEEDGGAEVFFDNLDELPNWNMIQESEPEDDNGFKIRFTIYKNSNPVAY